HYCEEAGDFPTVPFSERHLNAPLSAGGLSLGVLHEFCAHVLESEFTPAVTAFAAATASKILHHHGGTLLWATVRNDCYAPALSPFGFDPSRIIWVHCWRDDEVLSVMEEALHSRALAVVIGEAVSLSTKAGRRLAAAARQSATTALLLRRHFR